MGVLDSESVITDTSNVQELNHKDIKTIDTKDVDRSSRYMKILTFWLTVSGLWKHKSNRTRNKPVNVIIFSMMFMGFTGTFYELFNSKNINSSMEVLMTVFLIGHSISTYLVLIWKQPYILKLLSIVECRFDSFSLVHLEHSRIQDSAETSNAIWSVMISVIIFSVHTSSVVVSKGLLFHLPLEERALLLPITIPFRLTEWTFYLIYILELVCMVCEAITHITSITLCTGFINILCAEFSVLGQSFRLLPDILRRKVGLAHRPEVEDLHANDILNSFVDHHIMLLW